jgi:hypothetical protein
MIAHTFGYNAAFHGKQASLAEMAKIEMQTFARRQGISAEAANV